MASKWRPLRLDFYILGEVIGPFLGGTLFFLFVFLMFQALRLADSFIVHGVAGLTVGKMALLLCLSFLPKALPIAFLIAVLIGFGRLSADSELVAMKASGIGLYRLTAPVALFSIPIVALSFMLNMEWCPWGERAFKNTLIKVYNTKIVSTIKEGTFTSGFFDLLIFADKVDNKTNGLKRVFIFDEREPKNPLTVVAQSGEILPVRTGTELGSAAMLKLYGGSIHRNDLQGNTYQKIDFGEYRLYLKIDEGAPNTSLKPQMLSHDDLMDRISKTTSRDYEGLEMRSEYWRRCAVALSPLIFVFLGIGFGTVRTRAVRSGAVLIAFATLIVYWGFLTTAAIIVQRGFAPPFLAMELPNIVVFSAAIFAFRRAAW